jgi:hypothetical protein
MLMGLAAAGLSEAASAQMAGDAAVQAQWFTGSLEAPSPALPKAGILAVEPYVIYQSNTGAYDFDGRHYAIPNDVSQVDSVTVFKYAFTNRLSIEALPTFARVWNDQSNTTGVGDLPVEVEYRFNDENNTTGFPSITASLGVTLPTGSYDRLRIPLDGLGSGAYTAKEGLLAQSLFDTWGHHPMRLRFYGAAFEAIGNVTVHDISVYGTNLGFQGKVAPGFSSVLGIGVGYGLDQRWVLAFDLVQNFANGIHLYGSYALGNSVNTRAESNAQTAVAPAVEYNFSDNVGIIAGVEFSVAGRNTSSYVAPQIALAMSF